MMGAVHTKQENITEKGDYMGVFTGNPKKEPMHYGEVFAIWGYLLAEKSMIPMYQTLINHTGDKDLKDLLEEAIVIGKEQEKEIKKLLKKNGVALPPAPPERPEANLEDIPAGARIMDQEIASMVSMNTAKGLVACSAIMGESHREDIGLMFGKFHTDKAQFGLKALRLNKQKGWIISPPLHVQTPKDTDD